MLKDAKRVAAQFGVPQEIRLSAILLDENASWLIGAPQIFGYDGAEMLGS